jgi:hypothetical protein
MRYFLVAVMLLAGVAVQAQNFDNMMIKKQFDCEDVAYNSSLLFEKFYNANKLDSAKNLLTYWQSKCGLREPVRRAKILLAIKENRFSDSLLTDNFLSQVFNYQSREDMMKSNNYYSYDGYKGYYGYVPVGQEFDKFTKKAFAELKNNYDSDKTEFMLCEFYSENCDTILTKIQSPVYSESPLGKDYKKAVDYYLNMPEFHLSWITGLWIPTGELRKVGTHPELGFQTGLKHKKMNYDLTIALKFADSRSPYIANRDGVQEYTKYFFGGHIGIDVGRDILVERGHEIQVTGGIAFDGFDAIEGNEDYNIKPASANSYNLNFGLSYRYYITNSFYLGIRAKYNVVDYTLSNVVNYTGNPVTIQFIIGGVNNIFRNNNLRALKYKLRR